MRLSFWPQSLFGRLIAALVIAVVLAQAASLYLFARDRERFVVDSSVREWSRRITEITVLLEQLPIEQRAATVARETGHELVAFQSNAEHELIERIHLARTEGVAFLIFNPGGFTHTSIALRDALLGTGLPFIEVHLSNTNAREAFRRHSYFSDIAVGVISGRGAFGYEAAVRAIAQRLARKP